MRKTRFSVLAGAALAALAAALSGATHGYSLGEVTRPFYVLYLDEHESVVDPRLAPLLAEFRQAMHRAGRRTPIYKTLSLAVVAADDPRFYGRRTGLCVRELRTGDFGEIIDDAASVVISEALLAHPSRLRWAVFHELGHCLLDLDHESGANPDIMNPTIRDASSPEWPRLVERLVARMPPGQGAP